MSGRRRLLVGLGVALVAAVGGVLGACAWAEGEVRQRLVATAAQAGLRIELEAVDVSPLGRLSIERLRAFRLDDSEAFAVQRAEARWSVVAVLRGRRMPRSVEVHEPRAEVRVHDGQPHEAYRWRRVLRRTLRRVASSRTRSAGPSAGTRARVPHLRVKGGVVRVRLTGKHSELLPEGVAVRQIDVDVDATGTGRAAMDVTAPVSARWSGTVLRGPDGLPWITMHAEPPLSWPVPEKIATRTGVDVVRVGGAGWSGAIGAYLTDAAALVDGAAVAEISRLSVAVTGTPEARATGVAVRPAAWRAARPAARAG